MFIIGSIHQSTQRVVPCTIIHLPVFLVGGIEQFQNVKAIFVFHGALVGEATAQNRSPVTQPIGGGGVELVGTESRGTTG